MRRITLLSSVLTVWVLGCAAGGANIVVVDHRTEGGTGRYGERFDEAYYDMDAMGNLTLVLRRHEPARKSLAALTQVIVVKGVWRCVPGTTVAHATQINGTVVYGMGSGRAFSTYEGGGSVFFTSASLSEPLSGSIDHATLQPKRRVSGAELVFEKVELSGQFHAQHDPRQVRRLINDLDRQISHTAS